jgi:anti-sigma factor RsiW
MTATCRDLDGLLVERASGEMAAEDAARLDLHLEGCERCRTELAAYRQAFDLARLPPAEARLADLDDVTFAAYQRRRRRRVTGFTLGAGVVAAAAAAVVLLLPAVWTLRSLPAQQALHPATTLASAQLASTAVASNDTSDELAPEDVALAALDEAVSP